MPEEPYSVRGNWKYKFRIMGSLCSWRWSRIAQLLKGAERDTTSFEVVLSVLDKKGWLCWKPFWSWKQTRKDRDRGRRGEGWEGAQSGRWGWNGEGALNTTLDPLELGEWVKAGPSARHYAYRHTLGHAPNLKFKFGYFSHPGERECGEEWGRTGRHALRRMRRQGIQRYRTPRPMKETTGGFGRRPNNLGRATYIQRTTWVQGETIRLCKEKLCKGGCAMDASSKTSWQICTCVLNTVYLLGYQDSTLQISKLNRQILTLWSYLWDRIYK